MKILFAFENPLPSNEADAEVFITTARYLAPHTSQSWLHLPVAGKAGRARLPSATGLPVIRAWAPIRPAALRHLCCGLTLICRREFRQADLVYTRNLWVAWLSVLFGQRVVFDHYRPWAEQIPPLQFWIHRLCCRPRLLVNICHSEYTRGSYTRLQVPPDKLFCVHNGYEPRRLQPPLDRETAKQRIGVERRVKTVVYTGRINHKKGLALAIAAARRLPRVLFILVGSHGYGEIERRAESLDNVRIVGWQSSASLRDYIFAADVLLIPPSSQPLAEFGSTVLPLKLFLYLGSGRPILAGDTPDVREILEHRRNAYLCKPDHVDDLVAGINELITDSCLASRLAAAALADSCGFTWAARAERIAKIVAGRLQASGDVERCRWNRGHFQRWRRESRQWLMHLIRHRSWVMPPAAKTANPVSDQRE